MTLTRFSTPAPHITFFIKSPPPLLQFLVQMAGMDSRDFFNTCFLIITFAAVNACSLIFYLLALNRTTDFPQIHICCIYF